MTDYATEIDPDGTVTARRNGVAVWCAGRIGTADVEVKLTPVAGFGDDTARAFADLCSRDPFGRGEFLTLLRSICDRAGEQAALAFIDGVLLGRNVPT